MKTLLKGFVAGVISSVVLTVLALIVIWFTDRDISKMTSPEPYVEFVLPGVGLSGVLFAIIAVVFGALIRLFERINVSDDF